MIDTSAVLARMRPIIGEIKLAAAPVRPHAAEQVRALPFITISRQAGAGGWSLAQRLVEHLCEVDPGEPAWSCWDRELVERVAADAQISAAIVENLDRKPSNWLTELFEGLAAGELARQPSELKVYRQVAATIKAIARVGRAVIVGRGAVFVTRGMPGGVHIRLVAPLESRVRHMARIKSLGESEAMAAVHQTDEARDDFYKRFFPNESLGPETFTLTINTAQVSEDQMVKCILPLIRPVRRTAP